ncbi:p53 and DNA damage-regulated protein 1 [Trypanosoma theileri]|uniref:p53 and DNA damage-regulated protein 1 n=1 Tax=Trypanosoma theileri TaxID=67003 RepID=A0A1X0P149_9TRYP|nr:p53 and DNA damage-regulated protein 1 [Trypanosoma theileri]ORC90664.1 p53 and DNA damage-regulated protein 1 [Trypanosoma theileri]
MDINATHSTQLENAAEEVAEAKQYLTDLDRRQNQYREGSRVIKNKQYSEDLWLLCSGRVFVKSCLEPKHTLDFLSWRLDAGAKEIERARDDLKRKIAYLAELEGSEATLAQMLKGFELKPVN